MLTYCMQVRQLSHENVNPFIGACVEPEHVCILMVYAAKGSLHVSVDRSNGVIILCDLLGM